MQCWSNHSLNKADTSPKSPFLKCKLWYCREHTITVLSLNGFAAFVVGLKKRVRTIYYKQLLIVGCRVWENQRIFFATGVVSLVFLENTDDLILIGYHQCHAKDFEGSNGALFWFSEYIIESKSVSKKTYCLL